MQLNFIKYITMNICDFEVKDAKGNIVSLRDYEGKVLLIVNTATECGFTPQYKGLQNLYEKYREKGFEILDFPCNQFAGQAPDTENEIQSFCELKYKTTFRLFAKVDVNGKNADLLFTYLKSEKGGIFGSKIKWNFTKFLVDREGKVVKRFSPTTKPGKIESSVLKLL